MTDEHGFENNFGNSRLSAIPILDLTRISKSYPYLSLARQLGLPYGDVLIASDMFSSRAGYLPSLVRANTILDQMRSSGKHLICQLTCAVEQGEIGHGG